MSAVDTKLYATRSQMYYQSVSVRFQANTQPTIPQGRHDLSKETVGEQAAEFTLNFRTPPMAIRSLAELSRRPEAEGHLLRDAEISLYAVRRKKTL